MLLDIIYGIFYPMSHPRFGSVQFVQAETEISSLTSVQCSSHDKHKKQHPPDDDYFLVFQTDLL